jgi:hypothetical protein
MCRRHLCGARCEFRRFPNLVAAFIKAEGQRWSEVVKKNNIVVD